MTTTSSKFGHIQLGLIERDPATQPRAEPNQETVARYAEHMRERAEFPPVIVYTDEERYWLADGHHRAEAARSIGEEWLRAEFRQGSREDAILFGLSANATLKRTYEDKRRAVRVALELPRLAGKSDREIAAACAVSHPFVAKVRQELSGNGFQMPATREVTRGGSTFEMNTAGINAGRSKPEPEEKPEPEASNEPTSGPDETVEELEKNQEEAAAKIPVLDGPEPKASEGEPAGRPDAEEGEKLTDTEFVLGRLKAAFDLVDHYGDADVASLIDPKRRNGIIRKAKRLSNWLKALARSLESGASARP